MGHDPLDRVMYACVTEIALSSVRHDVRNRLAAVRQAAFFLESKAKRSDLWGSDPRIERFFALIDSEIDRANTLLASDGTVGDLHRRETAMVEVRDCVRLALESASQSEGVMVHTDMAAGDVLGDRFEVALAVRCLVDNAVAACPAGGKVTIVGGAVDDGFALSVVDGGSGFDVEEHEARRTLLGFDRPEGSGFGLAIAHRVVSRHGGRLSFEHTPEGFAARLFLPNSAPEGI